MQCLHCYTEIKCVQDRDDPDTLIYIRSKASRYRYYEDDLFCLWPDESLMHVLLPLDRIDEVIYNGRQRSD